MVQKALGHADLSTTMIYTHIVDEELEGAMKSFRGSRLGIFVFKPVEVGMIFGQQIKRYEDKFWYWSLK